MRFLIDNLPILLFAVLLIGGYLFIRLFRKQAINVDSLLRLVWQSVAFSLTFTYVIGTFDYYFFKSSFFGFSTNDVGVIIIPGALCIAILAASVYYKYIGDKQTRRGKK